MIPHDQLHEIVKFFDCPVFEELKDDLGTAEVSWEKFCKLPYEKQLANMAEEVMVLSLERVILPAAKDNLLYNEKEIIIKFMAKMCYHYLPIEFRFFAIDNFFQVVNFIPKGFAEKVIGKVI